MEPESCHLMLLMHGCLSLSMALALHFHWPHSLSGFPSLSPLFIPVLQCQWTAHDALLHCLFGKFSLFSINLGYFIISNNHIIVPQIVLHCDLNPLSLVDHSLLLLPSISDPYNYKAIEYLKLEGTMRIIESNSLLLAGLPEAKPYHLECYPDAPWTDLQAW